jgi:multidrug efflux pump
VRKRINDHKNELPQGVLGPFFNDEFGDTFGTIYAFSGEGFSPAELKDIVEAARQRILAVKDVAKADLVGAQDERFYVEFSHRRLATLGLDVTQVLSALRQQTAVTPSGEVETATDRIAVRITGGGGLETALADVPIAVDGRTVRIGDIATVVRGYRDPPATTMRFNG